MSGGRQPNVQKTGITERGGRQETWREGQSCCSGWPFVQGRLGCSRRRGVRKRPELRQTAARNPRFEREVKFAPYSACVNDRSIPGERAAVRRSNFPQKEKGQQVHQRGEYRGAGQDSLR